MRLGTFYPKPRITEAFDTFCATLLTVIYVLMLCRLGNSILN